MLKLRLVHSGLLFLALTACHGPTNNGLAATPTATPGNGSSGSANSLPLEVVLQSSYAYGSSSPVLVTEVDCQVPTSQAVGTNLACAVAIPEGRLHYSHLFFNVKGGGSCEIIAFQPYYFTASLSAGYFPPWQTSAIDCSVSPTPTTCYEGAAPQLQTSFPTFTGFYYTPTVGGYNSTYELKSANELSRPTNRFTANNLPPGGGANQRGSAISYPNGEKYVANTMIDYYFSCRDRWNQLLYGITLTIGDAYDSTGTVLANNALDYFPDWVSTNHLEAPVTEASVMQFFKGFSKP